MGQSERRCESHQDQFHRVARCRCFAGGGQEQGETKVVVLISGDLQLFQSEEAKDGGSKALRPGVSLAALKGGGNDDNPLYVFYPDMNRRLDCITGPEMNKAISVACFTEFILP